MVAPVVGILAGVQMSESKFQSYSLADGTIRYRTQVRHPVTGVRQSLTASSEGELERLVKKLQDQRDALRYGETSPAAASAACRSALVGQCRTVRELWNRWLKTAPPSALAAAQSYWDRRLEPTFGDLAPWDVTAAVMAEWQTAMLKSRVRLGGTDKLSARTMSPKTVRGMYDVLARAFRAAIERHDLDSPSGELPWGRWKPAKAQTRRRAALTSTEELLMLIEAARPWDERCHRRGLYSSVQICLAVMTFTGMRNAEAAGLGWDHVRIDQPPYMLRIEYQAPSGWQNDPALSRDGRPVAPVKQRKGLVQQLQASAVRLLREHRTYLEELGLYRPDGPVFPSKQGRWRTSGRALRPEDVRAIAREAGLEAAGHWVTHSLRHSFVTLEVIASGGDIQRAAERVGHNSPMITTGYMHSAGHGLKASSIPDIFGGGEELRPTEAPATSRIVPQIAVASARASLPPRSGPIVPLPPPHEPGELAAPPSLVQIDWAAREKYRETRDACRAANRSGSKSLDLVASARRWLAAGHGIVDERRPPEVQIALRRCYPRAYARAVRAGLEVEVARRKGRASEHAFIANWRRILKATAAEGFEEVPRVVVDAPPPTSGRAGVESLPAVAVEPVDEAPATVRAPMCQTAPTSGELHSMGLRRYGSSGTVVVRRPSRDGDTMPPPTEPCPF